MLVSKLDFLLEIKSILKIVHKKILNYLQINFKL